MCGIAGVVGEGAGSLKNKITASQKIYIKHLINKRLSENTGEEESLLDYRNRALDEAIAHLEERVISLGEKEIPTSRIGEMVMRELKRLDKVAYIRFASVYRSFEDIESFESALKELK